MKENSFVIVCLDKEKIHKKSVLIDVKTLYYAKRKTSYRAIFTALVSLITVTLTCPG